MKKLTAIILTILVCLVFSLGAHTREKLHEALWWQPFGEDSVRCNLCPFRCILKEGQIGQCRVRKSINYTLYTLNYAKVVAAHVDPVEKKPVYHFMPASDIFSVATAGCNLHCKYCQNWTISQRAPDQVDYVYMEPKDIVAMAKKYKCASIAYTYTEPIIFYELVYDTAKLAKEQGILNVMVTGGYINEEPLRQLCKVMDVIKVDFKGYSKKFYREVVFGDLDTVLNTMRIIKEEGVWLEVVNLVVPTLNDSPEDIKKLSEWVRDNVGKDTPIHFSRFHPMYKLTNLPPTPIKTLEQAHKIAKEAGLSYVYIGNVPSHPYENTYCPKCQRVLIRRVGYQILENNIKNGQCKSCRKKIPGVWQK